MKNDGARLAVFDIALREVTAYDELELDTLGDRKNALFLIMCDTDDSFNSYARCSGRFLCAWKYGIPVYGNLRIIEV